VDGYFAHETDGSRVGAQEVIDLRPDAARKRLRECKTAPEACEAIREIVSNLLGCEEMAVYQFGGRHPEISLMWSFGIEPRAYAAKELFNAPALERVIAGEIYVDEESIRGGAAGRRKKVSAAVPIQFRGKTAAALTLFRLLPQKTKIDQFDRELFAVVSAEAGQPLFGRPGSIPGKREGKR
jgi:hypothetical protein